MGRALTAEWTRVPESGRDAAMAQWSRRREQVGTHGCHYWVFASPDEPDAYLEFVEGRDAAVLARARAAAGLPASIPILTEVELP
jgi:hypothetical protein